VTLLLDSSVSIPALVSEHPAHEECFAVVRAHAPGIAGHAWVETFAVATRLPVGRLAGDDVQRKMARLFPTVVWPGAEELRGFLQRCATSSVAGGATYDALVALAVPPAARLVSRDRRASATYRAFGVPVVTPAELA